MFKDKEYKTLKDIERNKQIAAIARAMEINRAVVDRVEKIYTGIQAELNAEFGIYIRSLEKIYK